jgi:hypothetical protein
LATMTKRFGADLMVVPQGPGKRHRRYYSTGEADTFTSIPALPITSPEPRT